MYWTSGTPELLIAIAESTSPVLNEHALMEKNVKHGVEASQHYERTSCKNGFVDILFHFSCKIRR
jgi:hypothetical protein